MARIQPKVSVPPEKFKSVFPNLKPTTYNDTNAARGVHNLRSIAWNPLGTWVATGCADKTLRVWNVDKPNVRQSTELKGHTASIEKVAFNPVKELELCSVSIDGTVKFWDVKTKALVNEVKGLGEAFTLAWAPDGEHLIVGNKVMRPCAQQLRMAPTWLTIPTGRQFVRTLADEKHARCFPSAGRTNQSGGILLGWEENLRHYWGGPHSNPRFPKFRASFPLRLQTRGGGRIHAKCLATGGTDSLISLWDTDEWNCERTITKMVGPVRTISFSFDGNYIVGGSDEGNGLEFTYAETGEHLFTFKTASPCPVVAWAPNRYALAYSDLGILRIISAGAK
ncbi:WD domain-containing protein [Apiospora kogelbergensis]|uniref:WD domain-containing protein n=1 Tax=Apiospora kogelbergensis TaxID=1337665 RepID=UPI0031320B4D